MTLLEDGVRDTFNCETIEVHLRCHISTAIAAVIQTRRCNNALASPSFAFARPVRNCASRVYPGREEHPSSRLRDAIVRFSNLPACHLGDEHQAGRAPTDKHRRDSELERTSSVGGPKSVVVWRRPASRKTQSVESSQTTNIILAAADRDDLYGTYTSYYHTHVPSPLLKCAASTVR